MEKTRLTWTLNGNDLTVAVGAEQIGRYNLTKLFSNFQEFDEAQQMSVVYGVKQNLSDKTARNKDVSLTIEEKADVMNERYTFMVEERIWHQPGKERISTKVKIMNKAQELVEKGLLSQEAYDILNG